MTFPSPHFAQGLITFATGPGLTLKQLLKSLKAQAWHWEAVLALEGFFLHINAGTVIWATQFVLGCVAVSPFLLSVLLKEAELYFMSKPNYPREHKLSVADLHQRLLLTQLRQSRIILLFSPINPPGWKISVVESRIKAITTVYLFCGAPI